MHLRQIHGLAGCLHLRSFAGQYANREPPEAVSSILITLTTAEALVRPLHLLFHTVRQLFDLLRLLDHIQRQHIRVRFIDFFL